jgi:hypothetical protein
MQVKLQKVVSGVITQLGADSVPVAACAPGCAWSGSATEPADTTVRVVVTPFNGPRKGKAVGTPWEMLPDLTAPTGAYSVAYDTHVNTDVTVTETALADDVSAPAAITRSVDWDLDDATGTGVKVVQVRAIEKRGTVWYAYLPGRKIWVRAGSTAAAAWTRAGIQRVLPGTTGWAWTGRIARLRTGVLVLRVVAVDKVGNRSSTVVRRQKLVRY